MYLLWEPGWVVYDWATSRPDPTGIDCARIELSFGHICVTSHMGKLSFSIRRGPQAAAQLVMEVSEQARVLGFEFP